MRTIITILIIYFIPKITMSTNDSTKSFIWYIGYGTEYGGGYGIKIEKPISNSFYFNCGISTKPTLISYDYAQSGNKLINPYQYPFKIVKFNDDITINRNYLPNISISFFYKNKYADYGIGIGSIAKEYRLFLMPNEGNGEVYKEVEFYKIYALSSYLKKNINLISLSISLSMAYFPIIYSNNFEYYPPDYELRKTAFFYSFSIGINLNKTLSLIIR